jgi:KDO2-lipid IV(A) lauroyltransferase
LKKPKKLVSTKPKILPENSLEKALVSEAVVDARNCLEMADRAVQEDRVFIARQLLDKALLSAPDNAGVVMAYGRFQLFRDEPELALATFQRATQLEPELFTANFFIGKTLLQLSMFEDARYAFRSALAQNEKHIPSLLELATVQEKMGRRRRAIQLLKKALALKPGAMVVSRRLAELVDRVKGSDGLFELLKDRNCNMAYRTLHVVARHLVRSGYFLNKPWFRKNIKCFIHYLETAGITDKKEVKQIIEHSFLSNLHYPDYHWRERALSHCTKKIFNKWVTFEGLELYRKAESRGKGVILVIGHFVPGWVATLALDRLGVETTSVAFRDALGYMNIKFKNRQNIHTLEGNYNAHWEHLQAIRALKKGGTVLVSGDAHMGEKEVVLPFMGRQRGFKFGFAALASATGAPMLPMFTSMDPAGHITVHIQPELKPRPRLARKKRIKDLIVKYVDRLEAHWKEHPGNLPWEFVYQHFCKGEQGF